MAESPTIDDVIEHTRLIVCFGGISMKNTQINQGGIGDNTARNQLQRVRDANVDLICVSPLRDDIDDLLQADWWPVRPNSDVALMLGLAHTLHTEGLHDTAFLSSHCVGYEKFVPYLTGATDGVAKDASWAANICDIDAQQIRQLARRMASEPCLMSISWSLQRTENGDQPYWMIAVLAAMLGNIGLPGQGVGYGYGCTHNDGFTDRRSLPFRAGALPQEDNPVKTFIPVARIADMLLSPGQEYPFNGQKLTYPDIKLVYWAGGNPYHHHQDLNRLRRAWAQPETIIVNEPHWTATARFADIVFPATVALEREDFSRGTSDLTMMPMHQVLPPYQDARDDYEILSGLAVRLGFEERFTEDRSKREWLENLWQVTVQEAANAGSFLPPFRDFWSGGMVRINKDDLVDRLFTLEAFRADPLDPALPDSLEVHGNPNVLTRDMGTSTLSQGTSAHSCLVEVALFDGSLPPVRVFDQPWFAD